MKAIPQAGFIALRCVASVDSTDEPSNDTAYCVAKHLIKLDTPFTEYDASWNDEGSNSDKHVSLYFNSEYHTFSTFPRDATKI